MKRMLEITDDVDGIIYTDAKGEMKAISRGNLLELLKGRKNYKKGGHVKRMLERYELAAATGKWITGAAIEPERARVKVQEYYQDLVSQGHTFTPEELTIYARIIAGGDK